MISPRHHSYVLIVIILTITSTVLCQRGRHSFANDQDEEEITRSRAASVDAGLSRASERLNSNLHTTKRPAHSSHSSHPSSISSSSSSSSSSVSSSSSPKFERDTDESDWTIRNTGNSGHSPKILAERPASSSSRDSHSISTHDSDRGSSRDSIRGVSSSRDSDRDDSNRRQPDTVTLSSIFTGEISSARPTKKKSRTTRPPQVTTQAPPVSPPSASRSPSAVTLSSSPSYSILNTPSTLAVEPGLMRPNYVSKLAQSSSNVPKSMKEGPLTSFNCGGNITLTSLPSSIRSPGWEEGNKYPPNAECVWVVSTTLSHFSKREPMIRIKIKHLEIEQDKVDCPYDYLELRGHKKLCGFIHNKEITVNASTLVIVFRTDSNYEDRGFDLEIFSQIDDCIPEIRASNQGEITSPGYPGNYPDSTDCWTLINANLFNGASPGGLPTQNFSITVSFEFIELEPDDQCAYDFVEFFEVDGVTKKPVKSLGKYCDESSIQGSADYSPDPRLSSSTSSSDNRNTMDSKAPIHAKGPYLLVHFKSDQLLNLKGFKANYKVEASLSRSSISDCDWVPDETAMTLASPNYPKVYPPNKDCSLILRSPRSDQKMVLIFETFVMEIDNNCTFDRLEIYDDYADSSTMENARVSITPGSGRTGSVSSHSNGGIPMSKEPTRVFCGHKSSKFKYLSGGPTLRLRFVSDSLGEYQGFFAKYSYLQADSIRTNQPVHEFEEIPQNASIMTGASHLLSCKPTESTRLHASSNNKNIMWFKENQLITDGISENGTRLLIREFSQSDVGRYTCKYGDLTSEAWLKIKPSPQCKIIFRKRPRDMTLSEGEFTILECNAISPTLLSSRVTITWMKDNKKVHNSSRVDKLKNGYLVINGVTKEDSGHYFCVVRLEDDPSCTSQAGARLDVNVRANVEDICGKPKLAAPSKQKPVLDSAGKIVGGIDAQKGAFPWQVMFWDVSRKSFCGGALLNERWIATAAHCFTPNKYSPPPPPLDSIIVRLGKFDQKENEDHEVNTKIQDIIKHPDYNPDTFDSDLALVRVTDHIIFTDYIKPICVGQSKQIIEEIFFTNNARSIKMGHVTGWGQLKENGPQPRYLQELRMPIVGQESCRKATSFAVTNNMFCAGYAQEIIGDACKGDSGGPFVGVTSDRWYLLGIVSWGEGCGRTGKYGYYTKVSNYVDWIKGLIKH